MKDFFLGLLLGFIILLFARIYIHGLALLIANYKKDGHL